MLSRNDPRGLCSRCLVAAMLEGGPLAESAQSAADRAMLPRRFGAYELLEEVARGGMGIVYRARQTHINRLVAVKVLASGEFAAPDFVKRFRLEAEAVASLEHPHIVPIYEVGECEGQPFFSMRFVEGGSLARRIANQASPITGQMAARWVVQLAYTTHFAHQRGILHRDIKPGNILLDAQDELHLTDFGLAKLVAKDSTLTRTVAMLGTPSYMSPEQARGEAKQLTTSVDVYGLGAVLYELLVGQPPFAGGTTMETVRLVLDKDPRRPSAVRPGIARDLETICLKCLAKEPSQRYGSAEALAHDLERWLRGEPILARPVSGVERLAKWVHRRPLVSILLATTLLALAASAITLFRTNIRIRAAQRNEASLRLQAERKTEESRQQLIRLNVGAGNRLLEDGDYYAALLPFTEALRLERGDPAREDIHRRRFATVLRHAPELAQLWFHDAYVHATEFSPSGERMISSTFMGAARVWNVATGTPSPHAWPEQELRGAKFTPDESRIYTVMRGRVQFWDAATGEPLETSRPTTARDALVMDVSVDGRWLAVPVEDGLQLFDLQSNTDGPLLTEAKGAGWVNFDPYGPYLLVVKNRELQIWKPESENWVLRSVTLPDPVRGLDFSHDGNAVAVFTVRRLYVWDLATATQARPSIPMDTDLFYCGFSPHDRWLVAAGWDGAARVFDARSAKLVSDSLRHRAGVARAIFDRDGKRLATASWDRTARVWDPRTGEAISPSLPHGGYVASVNFSPDGTRLATAGQDQTVRLWNLRTNNGARLVLHHERTVTTVQFSPSGRRLLTCGHDGFAKIWDVSTGRLLVALRRLEQGIMCARFSPDGKKIVTACVDGSARLWNAESGAEEIPVMRHAGRLGHVAFSPDGQRLATASQDGTARVWNVADGQPVTPFLLHAQSVVCAEFSPDGRFVLTASYDRTAQLWDAKTGERVAPAMKHEAYVMWAKFSPDGRRLVTACSDEKHEQLSRSAQMWDAYTGQPIGPPLAHLDGVLRAEFSPNGRFLATGGEDGRAVVWNASTGARLTPFMIHTSYAVDVKFSPDSRLLLTADQKRIARVWESSTGEPVTPPLKHSGDPVTGCWSPDSREVAVGGTDGAVWVWDVSPISDSIESLARQAELLSAHRIEPELGLTPLTAKELNARWRELRKE